MLYNTTEYIQGPCPWLASHHPAHTHSSKCTVCSTQLTCYKYIHTLTLSISIYYLYYYRAISPQPCFSRRAPERTGIILLLSPGSSAPAPYGEEKWTRRGLGPRARLDFLSHINGISAMKDWIHLTRPNKMLRNTQMPHHRKHDLTRIRHCEDSAEAEFGESGRGLYQGQFAALGFCRFSAGLP